MSTKSSSNELGTAEGGVSLRTQKLAYLRSYLKGKKIIVSDSKGAVKRAKFDFG